MMRRWILSRTVREACESRRRVRRMMGAQRDLLSPRALESIQSADRALDESLRNGSTNDELKSCLLAFQQTAQTELQPYPHPQARENVDVLFVAIVIALAIRAFFVQPMAIPTGSMEPTLYGVRVQNLKASAETAIPSRPGRLLEWFCHGDHYYIVKATAPGKLRAIEPPRRLFLFFRQQRFLVGETWYTIWNPPATLPAVSRVADDQLVFLYGGIDPDRTYQPGDVLIALRVTSGDHLLADRLTYNFRRPARGEIVIFESTGIPMLTQNTHFIKRLIGLPGDRVQLGDDRHVRVNGQRLDARTPHFERIYNFDGPPGEGKYSGHLNQKAADRSGHAGAAPLFPNEKTLFTVKPERFFVLGDNTLNSFDSRYWGDFPQRKVIGRCAFVFWPFSDRFGWGFR